MESKIRTVQQLVNALQMCVGDYCIIDIMEHADIPESDFEQYYSWNEKRYTRNLIAKTERFEVLLVCWEAGQSSTIHDFNSHEAWIHPISGQLKEECFIQSKESNRLLKVSSVLLRKNDYSYMRDVGIHRYSNVNNGARTTSLVIFSPPLSKIRIYDEITGNSSWMDVWYDKQHNLHENEESAYSTGQALK